MPSFPSTPYCQKREDDAIALVYLASVVKRVRACEETHH